MKVPAGVSDASALLLGDILSTGFFCAEQAGIGLLGDERPAGGTYAVVGCGPVGLMTVLAAKRLGAEELFAIDAVPERLATAERLGAIPLNYRDDAVVDLLREATDGRGVDAVMEAVGARAATELAISALRPGGVLSSVGVHTEDRFGFTPVTAYDKNLTFRSGRCPARAYMQRLAPLVADSRIDAEFVFSHRLPLSDGVHGYEIFDKKLEGCTKVLLEP
jgi:threonine dehydrogenase-like Zn-dependent dehydrogenase